MWEGLDFGAAESLPLPGIPEGHQAWWVGMVANHYSHTWRPAGLLPPQLLYKFWHRLIQNRLVSLILNFLTISVFFQQQSITDML